MHRGSIRGGAGGADRRRDVENTVSQHITGAAHAPDHNLTLLNTSLRFYRSTVGFHISGPPLAPGLRPERSSRAGR